MTPNLRIFASEDGAIAAEKALGRSGFVDRTVILPKAVAGREADAVDEAIRKGLLPARYRNLCVRHLREGHPLVAVAAPFGSAETAILLMDRGDTVDTELMRRYGFDDAAPLSDALGIATVVDFTPSSNLISSHWYFFGSPRLSSKAAPLSSMLGMPTLSRPKRDWNWSWGLPLLSRRSPAPFSALFGLPTLSGPKKRSDFRSSLGLPLLGGSAAPLSNLLGLKVLVCERGKRK